MGRTRGRGYFFSSWLLVIAVGALVGGACAAIPPIVGPKEEVKQVLNLAMPEPLSIDPGLATGPGELTIVNLLFEPLVRTDKEGALHPAAAEKWEISGDGRTFFFEIRAAAKWQSDKRLSARDFLFAWNRNLSPSVAGDYAYLLYAIDGAQDYAEGLKETDEAVAIQAPSPEELRVRLKAPSTSFLARAATPAFMPLPRGAINDRADRWTEAAFIDGNGPYKLAEWFHGESMRLVPNPHYWDASRRRFDEIRIKLVNADEALIPLIRNQAADVIDLRERDLQAARESNQLRPLTAVFPLAGNWFLVFNAKKSPWTDARVRRAFSLALDREKLVAGVFTGPEQAAYSLVPPGIRSGQPPQPLPAAEAAEEAKRLMAEAGFPGGSGFPAFKFSYHQTDQWDRLAGYLAARWSEVLGVQVASDVREWRDYLDFTESPGDFDIYRAGWNSEYLDPENWHNTLWWSKDDFLRSGWSNSEYDQVIDRANLIENSALRKETYAQADAILDAELPGIPIANRATALLIQPYVTGVWVSPLGGYLLLDEAKVDRPG